MSIHPTRDDRPDSTPGTTHTSARLPLELPWLLGVLAGWVGLVVRGQAFVPMRFPAGHDWFEYLADAWMAWHRIDVGFHAYRGALYPYLLGAAGERAGYALAGLLISSTSMCLVVLAAGLGARALAGPWAGAVAAASIPLVNSYAASARWVNMYPALAAACGLALALGACAARWPRPAFALGAGLVSGLAVGLDARGLTAWATVALLAGTGLTRLPSAGRRLTLSVVFLLASIPGPMAARAVALRPPMAASDHSIILRRDAAPMFRNRPELARACGGEPAGEALSLEALRRPCARALLRYNAGMLDQFLPFGLWGSLGLLALALLPGRRGWRESLASAAALGWTVPILLLPSLWVVLPERYLIPVAVPLAMLPPVGAARAMRSLWPSSRAVAAARLAALLIAGWLIRYGLERPPVERLETHVLWAARGQMMEQIEARVRPGDTLLDCSGMALEAGLLPRRFHTGPPSLSGVELERCERWLEGPERGSGAAWIVTGVSCEGSAPGGPAAGAVTAEGLEPDCRPVLVPRERRQCAHRLQPWKCTACSFEARASSRWEKIYEAVKEPDRDGSMQLWRWR